MSPRVTTAKAQLRSYPLPLPLGGKLWSSEARQWPDIIVSDLASTAGPFANGMTIIFGGTGVVTIEEPGEAIDVVDVGVAAETASVDESSDEIVPELERTIFAKTVCEPKANGKAEFGRGRGVIHPSSSLQCMGAREQFCSVAWAARSVKLSRG